MHVTLMNDSDEIVSRRTRETPVTIGSHSFELPDTRAVEDFLQARERWRKRLALMPSYEDCEEALIADLEAAGWEVSIEEQFDFFDDLINTRLSFMSPPDLDGPGLTTFIDVAPGFVR